MTASPTRVRSGQLRSRQGRSGRAGAGRCRVKRRPPDRRNPVDQKLEASPAPTARSGRRRRRVRPGKRRLVRTRQPPPPATRERRRRPLRPSLGRPVPLAQLGRTIRLAAPHLARPPRVTRLGESSRPDPLGGNDLWSQGSRVAGRSRFEPSRPATARTEPARPSAEPSRTPRLRQSPLHQSPVHQSPVHRSPRHQSPRRLNRRALSRGHRGQIRWADPSRPSGRQAVRSGAAGFVVGASASVRRGPLRGNSARVVAFGVGPVRGTVGVSRSEAARSDLSRPDLSRSAVNRSRSESESSRPESSRSDRPDLVLAMRRAAPMRQAVHGQVRCSPVPLGPSNRGQSRGRRTRRDPMCSGRARGQSQRGPTHRVPPGQTH